MIVFILHILICRWIQTWIIPIFVVWSHHIMMLHIVKISFVAKLKTNKKLFMLVSGCEMVLIWLVVGWLCCLKFYLEKKQRVKMTIRKRVRSNSLAIQSVWGRKFWGTETMHIWISILLTLLFIRNSGQIVESFIELTIWTKYANSSRSICSQKVAP